MIIAMSRTGSIYVERVILSNPLSILLMEAKLFPIIGERTTEASILTNEKGRAVNTAMNCNGR